MTPFKIHPSRRRWLSVLLMIGTSEASGIAASEPVLHEYFEPNPTEDIALGTTTGDGNMAAAITTRSGIVQAPNPSADAPTSPEIYGGDSATESRDPGYHIDRNTTRPDVVSYSDPFTPSIPPFKRLYAYDSVDSDFGLAIQDRSLVEIGIGGSARDTEDQFYADLQIDAVPSVPIRIPSVGPATRVLVARAEPETRFTLLHDHADNWFVKSDSAGRFRLILQLAIDRRVFGSAFANTSWASLQRFLPAIPEEVVAAAREVSQSIGIQPEDSPNAALEALVAYFREFSASEQTLTHAGRDLYTELCSSKKGVCRHRAYGFVVTALGLGLPARFVHNEAHAWVEVFDGALWHRIDLGGAAGRVALDSDERPTHVVPPDPHRWPPGGTSAEAMTERALRERAGHNGGATGSQLGGANGAQQPQSAGPSVAPTPSGSSTTDPEWQEVPTSTISLDVREKETRRGGRIRVSGNIAADGKGCSQTRVDVALSRSAESDGKAAERVALGTLSTNDQGAFSGSLVVPFDLPVGDYELVATTPGRSSICGRGSSP